MYDENLHIIPDPRKGYPTPDLPADEAWSKMESLLDAEIPVSLSQDQVPPPSPAPSGAKWGKGLTGFNGISLTIFVIAGALIFAIILLVKPPEMNLKPPAESSPVKTDISSRPGISARQQEAPATSQANERRHKNNVNTYKEVIRDDPRNRSGKGDSISFDDRPDDKAIAGRILYDESKELANPANLMDFSAVSEEGIKNMAKDSISKQKDTSEEVEVSDIHGQSDNNHEKNAGKNYTGNFPLAKSESGLRSGESGRPGMHSVKKGNDFFSAIRFGISGNADLPLKGTTYYFTGYNTKNQPHLLLKPGIWLGYDLGKSEILVQARPVHQSYTGKTLISSKALRDSTSKDSIFVFRNGTSNDYLLKTFGIGFDVQYNYKIKPSILIGMGLSCITQGKSLMRNETVFKETGMAVNDSVYGIRTSSSGSDFLRAQYFAVKTEAAWRRKSLDIGADFSIPVTNLSLKSGLKIKPVSAQVFLRWRIKP